MASSYGGGGDREGVEKRLRTAMDNSRQAYQAACKRCDQVALETPDRAMQGSDGLQRIQQAASVRKVALANYQKALKEFTALILDGRRPKP